MPTKRSFTTTTSKKTIPVFIARLWRDLEPIIRHTITVLVIEASLLGLGHVGSELKRLFPTQQSLFDYFESIDFWLALFFLCLYGFAALAHVGISLLNGLVEAWQSRTSNLDPNGRAVGNSSAAERRIVDKGEE